MIRLYLMMIFHWSFSDRKSPQISRTLLSILAVLIIIIIIIILLIWKFFTPALADSFPLDS